MELLGEGLGVKRRGYGFLRSVGGLKPSDGVARTVAKNHTGPGYGVRAQASCRKLSNTAALRAARANRSAHRPPCVHARSVRLNGASVGCSEGTSVEDGAEPLRGAPPACTAASHVCEALTLK